MCSKDDVNSPVWAFPVSVICPPISEYLGIREQRRPATLADCRQYVRIKNDWRGVRLEGCRSPRRNVTAHQRRPVLRFGINSGTTISSNVKTAISIDNRLLQEADETARLMGLSRSRLFALAIGEFLKRQRREQMLLRLNEVYANGAEPVEKRLLNEIRSKVGSTVKERW